MAGIKLAYGTNSSRVVASKQSAMGIQVGRQRQLVVVVDGSMSFPLVVVGLIGVRWSVAVDRDETSDIRC